ncbi:MAG: hypothetical protein H6730_37190 [Deltaproteobacteria bacterium]|nr:hypothetical protein [Deltaproteobacteria bacterium]
MSTISRIKNLVQGKLPKPSVALPFEKAVMARARRYSEIRKLVAEAMYLRAKLTGEVHERRAEVARLHHQALLAERAGRGRLLTQLERQKSAAHAALVEAEDELRLVQDAVAEATEHLRSEGTALGDLERERASAVRVERVQGLAKRLSAATRHDVPNLEQARLRVEQLRAERALEAELSGRRLIG